MKDLCVGGNSFGEMRLRGELVAKITPEFFDVQNLVILFLCSSGITQRLHTEKLSSHKQEMNLHYKHPDPFFLPFLLCVDVKKGSEFMCRGGK